MMRISTSFIDTECSLKIIFYFLTFRGNIYYWNNNIEIDLYIYVFKCI